MPNPPLTRRSESLYWFDQVTPTGNPDARVPFEGSAPVWTDHVREAKAAMRRTAIMLHANGFPEAGAFLDKEAV